MNRHLAGRPPRLVGMALFPCERHAILLSEADGRLLEILVDDQLYRLQPARRGKGVRGRRVVILCEYAPRGSSDRPQLRLVGPE